MSETPPLLEDFEFNRGQYPEGCVAFYKTELKDRFAKRFVTADSPGVIYLGIYKQVRGAGGIASYLLPAS